MSNISRHPKCEHRTELGNCLPIGGFCTAVPTSVCEVENGKRISEWIPVNERLPEERDAGILKKLGTSKRSDYVLITVDVLGERMTDVGCTFDGIWNWDKKYAFPDYKVIAWMPLPEPYGEEQERD